MFVLPMVAPPAAQAQTFTVLHTFTGLGEDGANPYAGLIIDRAGNLYGTTHVGGTGYCPDQYTIGCGTVFKMKNTGSGWLYQPLYNFAGQSVGDGQYPQYGMLAVGPDGSFYGTTAQGGGPDNCGAIHGCGTVFKLQPPPTRPASALTPWTEDVLYVFETSVVGIFPSGNLVFDAAGNLYGTTLEGGTYNQGEVYELTPAEGQWTQTIIHAFVPRNDGEEPYGGLFIDPAGNLWGTAWAGGSDYWGTVFEFTPSDSGWTENTIHNFQYQGDGWKPFATLTADSAGNFYGSTSTGPNYTPIIFELSPYNGYWTYSIIYSFGDIGASGPAGPLLVDSAGNLYGTTAGDNGYYGSVFKLSPYNGQWIYTDLHDFTRGPDGGNPYSNVVMDAQGNLYGTTSVGGNTNYCQGGCGTVWEVTP